MPRQTGSRKIPKIMTASSAPEVLRVATYNVHQCVGCDGRYDLERVAQVLRELDARVVALQEVHVRFGSGAEHPLDLLAEATGMESLSGPVMLRADGHYGNALLTDLPVLRKKLHDISYPGREPRAVMELELDTGKGTTLCVVATHLGLHPGERRHQTRRLLEIVAQIQQRPLIVLGDFNEWLPWGRPLRWLRRHVAPTRAVRTFPARWPLFALDRILVAPRSSLVRIEAFRSPAARLASDHLPLYAEIHLESTPGVTDGQPD